jgi:hypothetical protein
MRVEGPAVDRHERNRRVARVLLAIIGALVLATFAAGIRW